MEVTSPAPVAGECGRAWEDSDNNDSNYNTDDARESISDKEERLSHSDDDTDDDGEDAEDVEVGVDEDDLIAEREREDALLVDEMLGEERDAIDARTASSVGDESVDKETMNRVTNMFMLDPITNKVIHKKTLVKQLN